MKYPSIIFITLILTVVCIMLQFHHTMAYPVIHEEESESDSDCEFEYGGVDCHCDKIYSHISFNSHFRNVESNGLQNIDAFHDYLLGLVSNTMTIDPQRVNVYYSNLNVTNIKQHAVVLGIDACEEDSSEGSDDDTDANDGDGDDNDNDEGDSTSHDANSSNYTATISRASLQQDPEPNPSPVPVDNTPRRQRLIQKWRKHIQTNHTFNDDETILTAVRGVKSVDDVYDPHCVINEDPADMECPNGTHPDNLPEDTYSMSTKGIVVILILSIVGTIVLFIIIYFGLCGMLCSSDNDQHKPIVVNYRDSSGNHGVEMS